jgi:hypothetical protein
MTTTPAWTNNRHVPPQHHEPVNGGLRALRAATWVGLLVVAYAGLSAAGSLLPSPPAPWSGTAFSDWVATSDPSLAAVEVVRLIALSITWYLGVVTLLALVGRVSGARPLVALADLLALPFLRRTLHYALGAGLAVSLSGALLPVALATTAEAQTTEPAMPIDVAGPTASPHRATMRIIAESPQQSATPTTTAPATPTTTAAPVLPTRPDESSDTTDPDERSETNTTRSPQAIEATWKVQSGDHLWHIAGITLTRAWSRPPADSEVAGYLRTLIDVNRHRLAVADNPDLIFPGQEFVLPPVPSS